jgi:hypothetical protein
MNLTLDGWHKDEEAARLLMERVRTDVAYRPAALYFLGILARDGIEYEQIHTFLLDYARNDRDANTRQWAVEAPQFLRKDEALDDLFRSFREDPSNKVRDRAGCNLSDCGLFTRVQRMRMVPRF